MIFEKCGDSGILNVIEFVLSIQFKHEELWAVELYLL